MTTSPIIGVLLAVVMMAVGYLVLYYIIRGAVRSGTLKAAEDIRAATAAQRLAAHVSGSERQASAGYAPAQQSAHQSPPQAPQRVQPLPGQQQPSQQPPGQPGWGAQQ